MAIGPGPVNGPGSPHRPTASVSWQVWRTWPHLSEFAQMSLSWDPSEFLRVSRPGQVLQCWVKDLSKPTPALNDSEKKNSPGDERSAISTSPSSPASVPTSVSGPDGPWGGGELSPASSPLWVKALLSLSSNPANLSLSLCFCFFPTSLPLTLEFGALPVPTGASGGDGVGVGGSVAGRRRRRAK